MHVIASFTLVPINAGLSLSPFVAACRERLERSGLIFELHANGTNLEGDWTEVLAAIKDCHQTVHAMGAQRIFTTIQIGTRSDREQHMDEKLASVNACIEAKARGG